MSEKQIESMMTELQSSQMSARLNQPPPVSFRIPGSPASELGYQNKRTNKQLVKSVLYMSHLIRNGKRRNSSNEYLVNSLEVITSVMDNMYLFMKFGVGKNSKFLQMVSRNASKVWFVTLLFTIKNLIENLINLVHLKDSILRELHKCETGKNNFELSRIIINRYELKIEEIKSEIIGESMELAGSLNDLFFVSIEIFDWKINPKIEKVVGVISTFMSIYRMSRRSSN